MEHRYPFEEFDEQGARREADRFEASIAAEQPIFMDLATIEDIYTYYRLQAEHGKAEQLMRYALSLYPAQADLHYKQALLLADTGRPAQALEAIEEALHFQPLSIEYLAQKARILAQNGRTRAAFRMLEEALVQHNHSGELYYHLGVLHQQEKQYDQAIRAFEAALDTDAEYEFVLSDIIFCHELKSENQAAQQFLERYLDKDPFSVNAWYNLGMLHLAANRYEHAIEAFDYGLALQEDYTSLHLGKANALMELERYDLAARTLLEALSFDGRDISAMLNLAECYEQLEQYKRARFYYRKLTELYASLPDAWYGLGATLEAEGKHLQAIYYYKKATERYEEYYEAWVGIADCEYEVGNLLSAFEALSKAVEVMPDDYELWQDWAEKLYRDGHVENALELLKEGLDTNPEQIDLMYQYAAYALQAGQRQQGYTMLENALILDYEAHTVLFEYFPQLSSLKPVQLLLKQYRPQ
ncbi:MAG: tetratricopeptide repeat protein [Bacteroidetes bacterium]|jgi:tetratricopeptide (TPR) repeat protein|nr:tetratricopeptide repeat protein [Bacteroidota bacterium]